MTLDLSKIQLDSLVPNELQLEDDAIAPLRSTLSEAVKVNPDKAAQLTQLSRDTGIPTPAISTDVDAVQSSLNLKNIDVNNLYKTSPFTAGMMSSFDKASISHDDVDALSGIEGALQSVADITRSLPAGAAKGVGAGVSGMAELYDVVGRSGQRLLEAATPEEFQQYVKVTDDTPEFLKDLMGVRPVEAIKWEGDKLKKLGATLGVPADRKNFGTDVAEALGQVASQMAVTIANPTTGLSMMFGQGVEQQAARQRVTETVGSTVASDTALVVGGAATAFSEKLALDKLLNRLPPKMKNNIAGKFLDISIAGGIEAVQETAENVAHGIIEQLTTNPDAEILEGVGYEALVAGSAGSIARALLLTFVPGKIGKFKQFGDEVKTQTDLEQKHLDELVTATEKSKLKTRDAESFKQFVASASEDRVFLDVEGVAEYLKSKTAEEIKADPILSELRKDAFAEGMTATDIEIPMDKFLTEFSQTEHFEPLRQHMKLTAESDTPFRQEAAQEEMQSYTTRLMEEAQKNASSYAEAQDIFATVQAQLVDTGRMTSQQASAMASVVPAWATVQAHKRGVSVAQVFDESGLRIEGPQTGERARIEGEGFRFQQPPLFDESNRLTNIDPAGSVANAIKTENPDIDLTADTVTVYRATIGDDLRFNDFVALNPDVAEMHMQNLQDRGEGDAKIISSEVPVSDLMMGNDATEFVYVPKDLKQQGVTDGRQETTKWNEAETSFLTKPDTAAFIDRRRSFESSGARGFESRSTRNGETVWSVTPELQTTLEGYAPTFNIVELNAQEQAQQFHDAISEVKNSNKFGAAVYVYPVEEYQQMRLFTSEDGKAGIAVKSDGDIVSAFSNGGGTIHALLMLAKQEGGTKLDAFHTILPSLYAIHGFKETKSEPWNEEFKPEGWDKTLFKNFNNGEPDVVYMNYDADYVPLQGVQDGRVQEPAERDQTRGAAGRELSPLEDAPAVEGFQGPDPELVSVADQYAKDNGIELKRQAEYVEIDPERATRIGSAYENMEHAPQDPVVKEAYQNLIQQTTDQYRALEAAGYRFWFMDMDNSDNVEYASSPWNAMRDIRANKTMGIFPTNEGFGTDEAFDPAQNPLLSDTGIEWPVGSPEGEMAPVLANDLFRAVHDAFGHGLEGAGFRARGEENAWQAHVRLFTGSAVGAITSETRGQNSWLNYGPSGESNRTAKVEDTVFADQKTGLMPEWTWTEGRAADAVEPEPQRLAQTTVSPVETEQFKEWFKDSKVVDESGKPKIVYHGTAKEFEAFDPDRSIGGQYWFTTDRKAIEEGGVGAQGKGVIMDVYLSIQNPAGWNEYENLMLDELTARGYDGLALPDPDGQITYVAFKPEQIKSVQNVGTFSPTEANIYKQETRGYYEPANSLIRLTEASDLSTFLHEFAHFMYDMEKQNGGDLVMPIHGWFKRNATDVASEANTLDPDLAAPITDTQVSEYLDVGTTGFKRVDEAIERAVHEQFARGFEAYLMEGKAPSMELRNVFRTFARWLVEVYRSVSGDMRVNLDTEMRQVFDRLLATEEQINAAEARVRMEPLFTDAAMAGMTNEEWVDYQTKQEIQKGKSHETLRDKIIKQLTRQTEAWWKQEKSDLVDTETEKLKTEKVYKAADVLKTGKMKLDRAAVKEMVGEEVTDKRGTKIFRAPPALNGTHVAGGEGVHPDQAAAFLGYASGHELLTDILNAKPLKVKAEENAENAMLEKHGDIMNDGSIQKEADEAVANEERGNVILQELKILQKGTNKATLDRQMIETLAEENIGKLTFREINPMKYRKAEIKAAQNSAVALRDGNKEAAMQAKSRQALNFYLGKAATKARNDTLKIVDSMGRYSKPKVRESIIRAGNGYIEQQDKILARFEFRKTASLKFVDQTNQSLADWMRDRVEVDGDGLVLSPSVLNESIVTHWKNISYSELIGVRDSVKNIEHVARYANKIQILDQKIEFQKVVNDWTAHMGDVQPSKFITQRTTIKEGRNWGRWAMAQMTKIPYMASWLDGGERVGMSHDILVQPFNDAYDNELKMWKEVGTPILDMIQSRSKEDMKRHKTKIFIPELKDANNDGNLFGDQVIAVALNTGNQGNLKKMLLGEGWANPEMGDEISLENVQLKAVLSHMNKSDWELVQAIWDQMELLYPQLAEVHRRTTGLTPPKVESTPVVTEYGTFKGGYYPMKYDPNRSYRAELQEDKLAAETESMFGGVGIQASVNAGSTNERTGYYAPVRLSLDVVPNHFQETIHYITHHDAVRQTNKLIRNTDVAKTIKEKLGPEEFAQLKPWLNDIAKDGREAPVKSYIDSVIQRLRFGATLGIMGFSASTGIVQVLGLANTVAEVGSANTFQAIRSIIGSPSTMAESWEFAVANSKVMNHRMETMDREIRNAMKRLEGKHGVLAGTQEVSMKHIALLQTYLVDLPTWHAAYIKGMKEFDGDEARSYRYADWAVENIQGSGITKDMARIMRGQSETGKMFTMFMTFFSSLWNMERDLVRGAKSKTYSRTTVAAKLMLIFAIPVFMEMVLKGQLGGDDDDEETKLQKYLTNLALYPVASVPFLRDVAGGAVGDYGYNISPLAQLLDSGTRGVSEVVKRTFTDEEITTSQIKGATKLVGASLGVPGVNQVWKTGEHLQKVIEEGEDLTIKELLYGPER